MAVDISSSSSSSGGGGLGELAAKRQHIISSTAILGEEGRDSMRL